MEKKEKSYFVFHIVNLLTRLAILTVNKSGE